MEWLPELEALAVAVLCIVLPLGFSMWKGKA
jgi:hypothetical protein